MRPGCLGPNQPRLNRSVRGELVSVSKFAYRKHIVDVVDVMVLKRLARHATVATAGFVNFITLTRKRFMTTPVLQGPRLRPVLNSHRTIAGTSRPSEPSGNNTFIDTDSRIT